MATAAAEAARRPAVIEESTAAKITRIAAKAPVHVVLVVVGLLWLVPTLGLFFTSLLDPAEVAEGGWWRVFTEPSLITFENYRNLFDNEGITRALIVTAWVTVGATILPIVVAALAGYAFAWLEFPGRDWLFILVVALLVVPLQMALIPMFSLYDTL